MDNSNLFIKSDHEPSDIGIDLLLALRINALSHNFEELDATIKNLSFIKAGIKPDILTDRSWIESENKAMAELISPLSRASFYGSMKAILDKRSSQATIISNMKSLDGLKSKLESLENARAYREYRKDGVWQIGLIRQKLSETNKPKNIKFFTELLFFVDNPGKNAILGLIDRMQEYSRRYIDYLQKLERFELINERIRTLSELSKIGIKLPKIDFITAENIKNIDTSLGLNERRYYIVKDHRHYYSFALESRINKNGEPETNAFIFDAFHNFSESSPQKVYRNLKDNPNIAHFYHHNERMQYRSGACENWAIESVFFMEKLFLFNPTVKSLYDSLLDKKTKDSECKYVGYDINDILGAAFEGEIGDSALNKLFNSQDDYRQFFFSPTGRLIDDLRGKEFYEPKSSKADLANARKDDTAIVLRNILNDVKFLTMVSDAVNQSDNLDLIKLAPDIFSNHRLLVPIFLKGFADISYSVKFMEDTEKINIILSILESVNKKIHDALEILEKNIDDDTDELEFAKILFMISSLGFTNDDFRNNKDLILNILSCNEFNSESFLFLIDRFNRNGIKILNKYFELFLNGFYNIEYYKGMVDGYKRIKAADLSGISFSIKDSLEKTVKVINEEGFEIKDIKKFLLELTEMKDIFLNLKKMATEEKFDETFYGRVDRFKELNESISAFYRTLFMNLRATRGGIPPEIEEFIHDIPDMLNDILKRLNSNSILCSKFMELNKYFEENIFNKIIDSINEESFIANKNIEQKQSYILQLLAMIKPGHITIEQIKIFLNKIIESDILSNEIVVSAIGKIGRELNLSNIQCLLEYLKKKNIDSKEAYFGIAKLLGNINDPFIISYLYDNEFNKHLSPDEFFCIILQNIEFINFEDLKKFADGIGKRYKITNPDFYLTIIKKTNSIHSVFEFEDLKYLLTIFNEYCISHRNIDISKLLDVEGINFAELSYKEAIELIRMSKINSKNSLLDLYVKIINSIEEPILFKDVMALLEELKNTNICNSSFIKGATDSKFMIDLIVMHTLINKIDDYKNLTKDKIISILDILTSNGRIVFGNEFYRNTQDISYNVMVNLSFKDIIDISNYYIKKGFASNNLKILGNVFMYINTPTSSLTFDNIIEIINLNNKLKYDLNNKENKNFLHRIYNVALARVENMTFENAKTIFESIKKMDIIDGDVLVNSIKKIVDLDIGKLNYIIDYAKDLDLLPKSFQIVESEFPNLNSARKFLADVFDEEFYETAKCEHEFICRTISEFVELKNKSIESSVPSEEFYEKDEFEDLKSDLILSLKTFVDCAKKMRIINDEMAEKLEKYIRERVIDKYKIKNPSKVVGKVSEMLFNPRAIEAACHR